MGSLENILKPTKGGSEQIEKTVFREQPKDAGALARIQALMSKQERAPEEEPTFIDKIPQPVKAAGEGVIKVLDLLDRPDRAFRSVIADALNDDQSFTPIKSAVEGFKGEGEDIGQLISDDFRKESPILATASDLALTIFTSPTTFLTGGLGSLTKAGRVAKTGKLAKAFKAKRILDKATEIGKKLPAEEVARLTKLAKTAEGYTADAAILGKNVAERVDRGQQALAEFGLPFSSNTVKIKGKKTLQKFEEIIGTIKGTKPIKEVSLALGGRPADMSVQQWETFKDIKRNMTMQELKGYKGAKAQTDAIADLISKENLSPEEVSSVLSAIELSRKSPLPEGDKLQIELTNIFDSIKQDRQVLGKSVIDSGFVPRIAKATMKRKDVTQFKRWQKTSPRDIPRHIKFLDEDQGVIVNLKTRQKWQDGEMIGEIPLDEAHRLLDLEGTTDALSHGTIKGINEAYGKKMFSEDAVEIASTAMRQHVRQKAGVQFLKKAEQTFGTTKAMSPTDVRLSTVVGKSKRYYPEAVAKELKRVTTIFNPGGWDNVMKGYDKVHQNWKAFATVLNIPFHSRNAISNFVQNYIGGVKDPTVYASSGRLLCKLKKGKTLTKGEQKLIDLYRAQGLDSVGWISGEVGGDTAEKMYRSFFGKSASKVMDAAYGVGGAVEDFAKLAHFTDKLKKGWTVKEASRSVRKYLFDYGDLTPFERGVMKRTFSFYSFTKKNLGMHLSTLHENPQRLLNLERALRSTERLNQGDMIPQEFMPEWMQHTHPFLIKVDEEGREYLNLDGLIASTDLDNFGNPKELPRSIAKMLTPMVKIPLELLTVYSWFMEKKFEDMPDQEFLGATIPPLLATTIQGIFRPLVEIDKLGNDKYAAFDLKQRVLLSIIGIKTKKLTDTDLLKGLKFMSTEDSKKTTKAIRKTVSDIAELNKAGTKAKERYQKYRIEKAKKNKRDRLNQLVKDLQKDVKKGASFLTRGVKAINR